MVANFVVEYKVCSMRVFVLLLDFTLHQVEVIRE
jgi:hypothetical protein